MKTDSKDSPGRNVSRENKCAIVLVVEDNRLLQQMVYRQLESLGIASVVSSTGQEAIEKLSDEDFDLVLMDCHLPLMDGYEATRMIRQSEGADCRRTPIIAMTASAMTGDADRCYEAGMDDYLSKPYTLQQLSDILHKWLPADSWKGPRASVRSETKEDSDALEAKLNIRLLEKNYAAEDLKNFLQMFISHADSMVVYLRTALVNKRPQLLRDLAHRLKGACSMIYATPMENLCRKIYQDAGQEDWIELEKSLVHLQATLEQTVAEIEAYLAEH